MVGLMLYEVRAAMWIKASPMAMVFLLITLCLICNKCDTALGMVVESTLCALCWSVGMSCYWTAFNASCCWSVTELFCSMGCRNGDAADTAGLIWYYVSWVCTWTEGDLSMVVAVMDSTVLCCWWICCVGVLLLGCLVMLRLQIFRVDARLICSVGLYCWSWGSKGYIVRLGSWWWSCKVCLLLFSSEV